MIKLGISAFYHDSAACIVIDGRVVAAVEEERFTGVKHDSRFPVNSIQWCLRQAKIDIHQVNQVCWYEIPFIKRDRVLKTFNKRFFRTWNLRRKFLSQYKHNSPQRLLADLGYSGEILMTSHHLSHSAFSYYTSPFSDAAVLTIDGVGEWETITISHGTGQEIKQKLHINFPNSLGMLYSTITAYLGFKPNEGEYKVMGLAPYGDYTKYYDKLTKVFKDYHDTFEIDTKYFTWEYSDRVMFNKRLFKLLGLLPRLPEEEITQDHKDLAAALQKVYEFKFLQLVSMAKAITKAKNLCLGGGCAYNGVANSLAYKYFDSVHIPFAPSDAGSAIGACLTNHTEVSPYLGPEYPDYYVKLVLDEYKDKIIYFKLKEETLIRKVAELLAAQKIVGWFQGKMEFGARALGNRSILASPTDPKMREKLNYVIKKREGFRPFAPSVTEDDASRFFEIKENVPYMNQVVKAKVNFLPAATHVDNSCRVHTVSKKQNRLYYDLLKEMKRLINVPVLLNTSFNLKDETITMSPKQAVDRFLSSKIDFLVINNFLIFKNKK